MVDAQPNWAANIRAGAKVRGQSGSKTLTPSQNIAMAIHRIMRTYKSYRLCDIFDDELSTPQFFQLCVMINYEDKIKEREHKKNNKRGRR